MPQEKGRFLHQIIYWPYFKGVLLNIVQVKNTKLLDTKKQTDSFTLQLW